MVQLSGIHVGTIPRRVSFVKRKVSKQYYRDVFRSLDPDGPPRKSPAVAPAVGAVVPVAGRVPVCRAIGEDTSPAPIRYIKRLIGSS